MTSRPQAGFGAALLGLAVLLLSSHCARSDVFTARRPPPAPPSCGDGVVDPGEECDDGNDDESDGCRSTCRRPSCGDGIVDPGEECDEGRRDDSATCLSTCLVRRCGDGRLDPGEECDDGNLDDHDACRSSCVKARCGDGVIFTAVEFCDDGNTRDGDTCKGNCGPPTCGNAIVEFPETCDDGNRDDGDGCLSSCVKAFCGDGFLRAGVEQCDDGNRLDSDACLPTCQTARCGDGAVRLGVEECDDANAIDDDLCDLACHLPVCGDGRRAGNEECDLGANNGDRPAFLISQPSGTRIATNPLIRAQSSAAFYGYSSASSHTGFEKEGESRIYLYADALSGRLSLVVTHGIDFDSTGRVQPPSRVDMDISGLPPGWRIDLADDSPSEFFPTGPTTAAGRWTFDHNSDGGVLGGLPFPGAWKITVSAKFQTGISTWGYVRDDLQRIPLVMTEPITIEAFDSKTACRKTCVIPRCGDKLLDGGEVCDDGNTTDGDGCAGDCHRLR